MEKVQNLNDPKCEIQWTEFYEIVTILSVSFGNSLFNSVKWTFGFIIKEQELQKIMKFVCASLLLLQH
jgi:hypothetical protein